MKYIQLTIEERETIQERLWQKASIRLIATELGRSPSTIAREIKRNIPTQHRRYTPRLAHERALKNRSIRGQGKLAKSCHLRLYVHSQLKAGWSPEQIAAMAKKHIGINISYEAIYQYIYSQIHRSGYGLVKSGCEDLRPYLARRRKRRMNKGGRKSYRILKGQLPSIENRPKEAENRKEVGHWEDDSILSSLTNPVRLRTTNERISGLVLISKAYDRTMTEANRITKERLGDLPPHTIKTLTRDRGSENLGYKELEKELDIQCYFAHSYCSWERGSNENVNGLIRRYFPKGTDFRLISEEKIRQVEYLLNSRPRKRLGWKTPFEVFYKLTGVALQT